MAHFPPSRPNLRHLRPRPGVERGAAGRPGAASGSAAVTVRSLGPHVVPWALAKGRRPRARVPAPCGARPGAPSATEALATSRSSSTRRCARPRREAAPAGTMSRRRAASGTLLSRATSTSRCGVPSAAPHTSPPRRRQPRGRGGAGERAPRAAHTRPSPPTALPPRPHVGTIFLPFSQAQLRVRVRVSLLLWRRAGPGGLRVHSASLRCAGARTRAALRGRPRRPRSPLRLTPKYPNPNFNPNPNPNPEPAARRAGSVRRAGRAGGEGHAATRTGTPRRHVAAVGHERRLGFWVRVRLQTEAHPNFISDPNPRPNPSPSRPSTGPACGGGGGRA